jgi:hypothetical protein
MLTFKRLRDGGTYNYKESHLGLSETIVYDTKSDEFLANVSFTPERYSNFELFDGDGCEFITFQNNDAYIHPILSTTVNNFYGISCDTYVGVILNENPLKIKRGIALEIQSKLMMYAVDILTENINFASEIPAARWKRREDKWNANFLCNKNAIGGLYGIDNRAQSDETRGYYIKVLLVKDNTLNLAYNVFDNRKREKYNDLDFILIKYISSEQSGFENNR